MNEAVTNAVNIVLSVFIMIGMGMLLTKIKWIGDETAPLLSKLVVMVALPFMIVGNLFSSFDQQSMLKSLPGIFIPIASILIIMGIGALTNRIARIPRGRWGVLNCMICYSNAVFVGVPVSKALFGNEAIPFTLMYYIANTALFWTIGVAMMRRDSGFQAARGDIGMLPKYLSALFNFRVKKGDNPAVDHAFDGARVTAETIKRAFPLPLIVFFVCMILVLAGVRMPPFIMSSSEYVGGMVTPLSLFFIGIIIVRMIRKRNFRWQRGYEWVILGRFVLSPLTIWLLTSIFQVDPLMRNVFIMQAAMPVMTQTSIVAESVGADSEYAAGATALSTILSLAVIPIFMLIL